MVPFNTLPKTRGPKYTVVGSGAIHSHRDYNVAVAVHHISEPVALKVGILGPSFEEFQTVELASCAEFRQITFKLPPLEQGDYSLVAEGVKGLEFKDSMKLSWMYFKPFIRIQTDKGTYKPGDTINYRVIFLNEDLLPETAVDEVVIWFEDSKGSRIKEEKHIKTASGVFTGKLELSELATQGTWSLLVQNGEQQSGEDWFCYNSRGCDKSTFKVEKYVLPKYSVKLEATKQVSAKDGELNVYVKASYTYGQPVSGTVLVNVNLLEPRIIVTSDGTRVREYFPQGDSVIGTADMVRGTAKLTMDLRQLARAVTDGKKTYYGRVTATVKEEFTGVRISESCDIQLYAYRYKMSTLDHPSFRFEPDKEHEVACTITFLDGTPVTDTKSVVKATYTEGIRNKRSHRMRYSESELPKIEGKTLTFESHLNELGVAVFKVTLPSLPDVARFRSYYRMALEFDGETCVLYDTYTPRESQIEPSRSLRREKEWFEAKVQLSKDSTVLKMNREYQVTLDSSRPLNYFVYNIFGRENVLETKRVELVEPQNTVNITLKPTFLTAPHGCLFFYYVDETGEFHYAEVTFSVEMELQNRIEIEAPEEVKPGSEVELVIKTPPKSFVGLLAVDQSVLLLGSNNDWDKRSWDWRTPTFRRILNIGLPRVSSDVVTMTNAYFYNGPFPCHMRRCTFLELSGEEDMMIMSAEALDGPVALPPPVRRNFRETWIFDDIDSTEEAVFKWVKTIPETITNWVLTGFSLHPVKGLGVTDEQVRIRTFQPFFVSVRLPFSVKHGEVLSVPVLVFNYLSKNLDVELTLYNEDDEYDFVDASDEVIGDQKRSLRIQVGSDAARGASFLIRPKVIGNILLKFKAISPLAGDTVHKTLKVIPEGITQYWNRAFFVSLKEAGEYKNTFDLKVPDEVVPGSERVEFGLVGGLLGPVEKNLDNLLRLPIGCGEQTMSNLVPNYLVWDYLKSIKKLTPALDTRIKRNLSIGCQNMLRYRHDNGSFSSFGHQVWRTGDSERVGSTWLTAYVLRTFSKIKHIVDVDEKLLTRGYEFLLSRQAENGSFRDEGEIFYGSQRSPLTITASCLLALLEEERPDQAAIDKAVSFLSSNTAESVVLLPRFIAIYALQRAKAPGAGKLVASLESLAQNEMDRTWWTASSLGGSHDVEITSYALLSLLESEQETADTALSTVRWLVAQRNSLGGFASSQVTVVGLTALTKFAKKMGYQAANWEVTVSNRGKREKTQRLSMSGENGLVLQTVEFPLGTNSLEFEAKGSGAALVQISCQYNVVEKEPKPSFKVETTVLPKTLKDKLELSVCVDYVEEDHANESNMAILEVSLPSGYTAYEESFKEIREVERVRLVETKDGDSVVVVYFENLSRDDSKSIPIEAHRTHSVADQKPSSVVVYDYYEPSRRATEFYSINSKISDICESDEKEC
ncbi:alpha-2-macroglobulin [Drosophila biarmipes]|uniref:alpha-2-macroglobulin n=1 Tax=Drosophila biarmipes TaxID=125945 RepID=UPI0007E73878|nr:alpha-2-macroglobulin [Drosophila biarmipes]